MTVFMVPPARMHFFLSMGNPELGAETASLCNRGPDPNVHVPCCPLGLGADKQSNCQSKAGTHGSGNKKDDMYQSRNFPPFLVSITKK